MKNIKLVKIFTILIHSFIIIGVGHGIGILLFFELPSIPYLIKNGFELESLTGEFHERLILVGLISIIGKTILIISLFNKSQRNKGFIGLLGILIL